jgi:hypothetical protein
MRLSDAREVIEHDYCANEPSAALVHAARRVLVELDQRPAAGGTHVNAAREQVDADLAIVDNPYACVDGLHRRLAAEVRFLRAELARQQMNTDGPQATSAAQEAGLPGLRGEHTTRTAHS